MVQTGQVLPVRVHQTDERIILAAPMPGLEPENIRVRVDGNRVVIDGQERGPHQGEVGLLLAEWTIGPYHREIQLIEPVAGALTNATYGNGVLVLSMPKVSAGHAAVPAEFGLTAVEPTRGERVGHAGHDAVAQTTERHWEDKHAATARSPRAGYRRIVVPLDGSEEAESAVAVAERLIGAGELVLLRVLITYDPALAAGLSRANAAEAMEEAHEDVAAYLARVAARVIDRGARARTVVESGHVAPRIAGAARDFDADLVVMTTRGQGARRRDGGGLGSVVDAVLRQASLPLVLVTAPMRGAARHAA